ncbi:hypothetical protein WJR50_06855 [Catalinimonas sp. 4WD22]|uniref:WD40/YVTN/BNR-like repeat-containing protein n=1 Tax=Catalinimonas locisalis TaxID=3133978 RepID=UPI003100F502
MRKLLLGLALGLGLWHIAPAQQLDMSKIEEGMVPRSIGPAGMSGRVTAIDVVESNPDIIYVGSASGGLWKSEGGGIDWEPIFDEEAVLSIGAIAIYQKNPNIIYVGTGEGNPRNSQSSGKGMYKSMDGGKSWKLLGLENTRNIHRVFVHPDNPDIVYAGVQGLAWADTEERGVYKSTDGGASWEKILYVNQRTGVGDMVMDPSNPEKLIVGMWEFRRWPWFFKSGGEGSGMYITYDGGENWEKRTDEDGLPKGEIGKIGLAIAASNPQVVYAYVESKKNAIYRSDDGGFKWKQTATENIGSRPFYYADLAVDPNNENRLYSVASSVRVSEDGGKNFEVLLGFDKIHVDHHAWYIHPENSDFMIDGNDGGLAITRNQGKSWRFVENLPLAQFYHINYDMEMPYNVMGGMQDNGSWRGPAYIWRAGGIRNAYWEEVAFGDGFDVMPDSSDSRYLYAMWQGGNLQRRDLESGSSKYIKPAHPDEDVFLRFNWDAAIAHDPFETHTIYYGSQFVHKSTDRGETWEVISPDLTTNDTTKQKQLESGGLTLDATQAENHTTITAIAPSLAQPDIIWVGTDDGNVQLTQDGGENWENVVGRMKDLPANTWVHQIYASQYNAGEAFVVFDDHRRKNWTPYVYHTENFGRSWTRLVDETDADAFALSIVQDPVEPNLLFLGTETGLYVSLDKGQNWTKWGKNYPHVSTMDLKIHPREHDLIIGTFGRAAYILDDIRPLREMAQQGSSILDEPLYVYNAPAAYLANYKQAAGTRFQGDAIYDGENRPYGAMITYSVEEILKKEADSTAAEKDSVLVEVLNGQDEVIRTFKAEAQQGMNRLYWDLTQKGVRDPDTPKPEKEDAPEPSGLPVLPGEYTVQITYGDWQESTPVKVLLDPRIELSQADMLARQEMGEQLMEYMQKATKAVDQLNEAKATIELINTQLKEREGEAIQELKAMAKSLQDTIKLYKELIAQKEDVQGILRDPHIVSGKLGAASSYFEAFWHSPNETQSIVLNHVKDSLEEPLAKVNAFFAGPWAEYQEAVNEADVSFFKEFESIGMED